MAADRNGAPSFGMHPESIVIDPKASRCARMRKSVRTAAANLEWEAGLLAQVRGERAFRKTFITLTYRQVAEWQPGHVSGFIRHLRQWFKRRGEVCRFVWVGELQRRGALHYHVLVWVPRRLLLPRPDECGWWPHGSSKIETARNPVGYMVKYATKTGPGDLERLPKGVRLHGNGGASEFVRGMIRLVHLPRWLRERNEAHPFVQLVDKPAPDAFGLRVGWSHLKRCKGGRVDADTGEFFRTPWRVQVEHGVATAYFEGIRL